MFCHVHAHCYWIFPQSSSACHVDPLPVIPCPAMTCHIIPCPATPWPKTQVMSYLVRSCPQRCDVLPLFVASKQVLTVGAMYEIPCSVCIKNALNHMNKNSAQNVHARHLDVHFRPSATHTTRRPLLSKSRLISCVPKLRDVCNRETAPWKARRTCRAHVEKQIAKVALSASANATAPTSPIVFSSSPRDVIVPLAL